MHQHRHDSAVRHPELFKNVVEVDFHRPLGQAEPASDVLVGEPLRDQEDQLPLPCCQVSRDIRIGSLVHCTLEERGGQRIARNASPSLPGAGNVCSSSDSLPKTIQIGVERIVQIARAAISGARGPRVQDASTDRGAGSLTGAIR